jgi:hypothetical protein
MIKKDLKSKEFNEYYQNYIDKVSDETALISGFEADQKMVIDFFSSLPKDTLNFRYQPNKWSVKEILQHLIDTERIFMHRFLRIARKDTTALSGFDQDVYIAPSEASTKTLKALLNEFTVTRLYSINLIDSISDENLMNIGTASNSPVSARACAFILLGHSIWHIEIIKERYV